MVKKIRFTLVELLVVITIIAILASMLLPVLKAAKEKSAEIACKGNLKQLGITTSFYITDNSSFLPFAYRPGAVRTGYEHEDIGAYFVLLAPYLNIQTANYFLLGAPAKGLFKPCVFGCPSIKYSYPRLYPVAVDYGPSTTAAFGVCTSTSPQTDWGSLKKIKSPSAKVWLGDIAEDAVFKLFNPWYNCSSVISGGVEQGIICRHSGKANCLFFDGHVSGVLSNDCKGPACPALSLQSKGIFDVYDSY